MEMTNNIKNYLSSETNQNNFNHAIMIQDLDNAFYFFNKGEILNKSSF